MWGGLFGGHVCGKGEVKILAYWPWLQKKRRNIGPGVRIGNGSLGVGRGNLVADILVEE